MKIVPKKDIKIPIKSSIIIDLEYELNNVDFSNSLKRISSYYNVVNILKGWTEYDDGSITEEQLWFLINYLQDSTMELRECYFNMIEMLEEGRYSDASV